MKKFLSILMALALVFTLSVPVFAQEDNTGSITITNATINETYKVYKIFDANFSKDANDQTDAVSYSITTDSPFFAPLFGADGKTVNAYFEYNANTGSVTKKKGVNDSELIQYLTNLVAGGTFATAADPVTATTKEVKFEGIPYGYYLITSSLGTTVTINSNTPDVSVIDKNQKPGAGFDKLIQTGVDGEGNPTWGDSNTANIGDQITYKISFEATNYDGDKLIKYYSINDEKGDAIWVDFDSFEVYVNGVQLKKGYYLNQSTLTTTDWEFLGDWSDIPEDERDANDAEWYLVHLDMERFRISIPWLTNHSISTTEGAEGKTIHALNFGEGATSKYASPSNVTIVYDAAVETNASIGVTSHGNRFNKAYASWTSEHETLSTQPEEVVTNVYGIGLLKDDIATFENLAGAKFRVWRDENCTIPVYVIPTDVQGIYVVDSKYTAIEDMAGEGKQPSRLVFAEYLDDYLKNNDQDNLVVSQINGKLAILGLAAGDYYLQEVEAPSGYNALTQPVKITAGEGIAPFSIFADANGNVADIQTTDGVHVENVLNITSTIVHNSKGVVLPSTGGKGTFWLITIGAVLAIGFAVFLITHKKMSVYAD